jgi:hypothetical protein
MGFFDQLECNKHGDNAFEAAKKSEKKFDEPIIALTILVRENFATTKIR